MKKSTRDILIAGGFIIVVVIGVFVYDYFSTQSLLKNGTRSNAMITGKFYEIKTKSGDTTSYSFRMQVVPDLKSGKLSIPSIVTINAYVKKENFNKYAEGATVKVVYENDDLDHARLVEEIE